ncbi:hypothetical protein FQA39_LY15035 [Lamprigera yunnana]|nr:hypothetical protein FQA39_LY15035 [Lamprigera yunnana]
MSSTLRGKHLHDQARKMAFNVYKWIKSQNEDQCTKEIKQKVSGATGVSIITIKRIIKEGSTSPETETDKRFKSPEKNMKSSVMHSVPTSCIQLAKEQIIKYSDPKYNINDLKTGDCETIVGLYYPFEFASVVKIFGRSKQYVIFKEEEWIQFHEQRENINNTMWKPRQIGSKTLTFEMIEEKKILKIVDMSGNEVYLGWESVSEVWSLESVF